MPIQPLSIRLSSQLALLQETNRILSIELQEKILEVEALREGGAVAGDGMPTEKGGGGKEGGGIGCGCGQRWVFFCYGKQEKAGGSLVIGW